MCIYIYIYIYYPPHPIYSPNVALLQLRCIAKTCLSSLHCRCECSFCGTVQQFCTDTSASAVLLPRKNHQKANKLCCPNKAKKQSFQSSKASWCGDRQIWDSTVFCNKCCIVPHFFAKTNISKRRHTCGPAVTLNPKPLLLRNPISISL